MKYAYWGLGVIMAGLLGIVFIAMFQSLTINNETEYYVLKEAMEASMLESVDIACYRDVNAEGCGEVIKISEQKFVENFTRRFVENISGDVTSYELEFYDIIESPPKASVLVKGITKQYSIMASDEEDGSFDIRNILSGILEYEPLGANKLEGGIQLGNNDAPLDVNTEVESTESSDFHQNDGECEDCVQECPDCAANTSGGTSPEEANRAEENATANEYEPVPEPPVQEEQPENKEENPNESTTEQTEESQITTQQNQEENKEEEENE